MSNGSENFTSEPESELDPSYAEMVRRAAEIDETEARVGRPPLPRSDFHIGVVRSISYREIPFDPPVAGADITLQCVAGSVPGAVGRFYRDTLRLEVGTKTTDMSQPKESNGRRPLRDRTAIEQRKVEDLFIGQMKRVQRVIGTASLFPQTKDEAGIEAWGSTALNRAQLGQLVIFTAYQDANGFSRIIFSSIRSPEDPARDYRKTGHPVIEGKTSLEQAVEVNRAVAEKAGQAFTEPGSEASASGESGDF